MVALAKIILAWKVAGFKHIKNSDFGHSNFRGFDLFNCITQFLSS